MGNPPCDIPTFNKVCGLNERTSFSLQPQTLLKVVQEDSEKEFRRALRCTMRTNLVNRDDLDVDEGYSTHCGNVDEWCDTNRFLPGDRPGQPSLAVGSSRHAVVYWNETNKTWDSKTRTCHFGNCIECFRPLPLGTKAFVFTWLKNATCTNEHPGSYTRVNDL